MDIPNKMGLNNNQDKRLGISKNMNNINNMKLSQMFGGSQNIPECDNVVIDPIIEKEEETYTLFKYDCSEYMSKKGVVSIVQNLYKEPFIDPEYTPDKFKEYIEKNENEYWYSEKGAAFGFEPDKLICKQEYLDILKENNKSLIYFGLKGTINITFTKDFKISKNNDKLIPKTLYIKIPKEKDEIINIEDKTFPKVNIGYIIKEAQSKVVELDNTNIIEGNNNIINTSKCGRNDNCPCNSGLKYKKCHGKVSN